MYISFQRIFGILCIGSIMALSGCRKSAHASGRIQNFFDGTGIEGVNVTVSEIKHGLNATITDHTWQQVSGQDGQFNLGFTGRRSKQYSYDISVEELAAPDTTMETQRGFIHLFSFSSRPEIDWKGQNDIRVEMAPAARVILTISNPQSKPVDNIQFLWLANNQEFGMTGSSGGISPVLLLVMPTNGQTVLKTIFVSNGISRTNIDTIRVKPFGIGRHAITL